jgi:hypothetical protein
MTIDNIVCVNSGEDQMARQRRLNRYLGGFLVSDFADHHLVRVVAKYRSKSARER